MANGGHVNIGGIAITQSCIAQFWQNTVCWYTPVCPKTLNTKAGSGDMNEQSAAAILNFDCTAYLGSRSKYMCQIWFVGRKRCCFQRPQNDHNLLPIKCKTANGSHVENG